MDKKINSKKNTWRGMIGMSLLIAIVLNPAPTHAIIVTPALILVPIAKIVGGVLAAASLPAAGWGMWWHRARLVPVWKVVILVCLLLVNVGLITYIWLKISTGQ